MSGEFPDGFALTTLVPHASDVDLSQQITNANPENIQADETIQTDHLIFSGVPQRELLYYDEIVDVYVILTSFSSLEQEFRTLISRLTITLEAYALQGQELGKVVEGSANSHGPIKEAIFADTVGDVGEPLLLFPDPVVGEDRRNEANLNAVWKLTAFLRRPRARVHHPLITFLATATLRPTEESASGVQDDEYLPSQVPAGINLLESFQDDPVVGHTKPYLSARRVARVTPAPPVSLKQFQRLESEPGRIFRAVPAVNFRMRYSRLGTRSKNTSVIASIEFETTPFAEHDVVLEEVDVWLEKGSAVSLLDAAQDRLPLSCRSEDKVALLYRLDPDAIVLPTSQSGVRILELFMMVKVMVSDDCRPHITMKWRNSIDFTPTHPPAVSPSGQPSQRNDSSVTVATAATASGTISANADAKSLAPTMRSETASNKSPSTRRTVDLVPEGGLIITTSGPCEVRVGEVFRWNIFIINRSGRERMLALAVIPKTRRMDSVAHTPSASLKDDASSKEVAEAIMDERVLHAMQRNVALGAADLVSLSTDVRVGPLTPAACHTVDLEFVALASGLLHVDAIRVVDLLTENAIDIHDLPAVFCKR